MILLGGCSPLNDPHERFKSSTNYATDHQWTSAELATKPFVLQSFFPNNQSQSSEILTVFIEGDGFSWHNQHTPSDNPTPKNPVALKIAIAFNHPSSVYLSRPCQNVFDLDFKNCDERYWTSERFSPEILQSMNQAIDQIKEKLKAKKIKLVGYSGGGVVALLLASQRSDIIHVTTIASNIDTDAWVSYHHLSPINVSNPALLANKLITVRQTHFIGEDDEIVPEAIARSYAQHYDSEHQPDIRIIKGFTHGCCWENIEKYQLKEILE